MTTRSSTFRPRASGPILVAVCSLLALGCDLAEFEPIVESDALPNPKPAALTLSGDATRVWVADYENVGGTTTAVLRGFDAMTGETLAERNIAGDLGEGWNIVGLAPETEVGHERDVWVLHQNGYQLRWNASLSTWNDWASPAPGTGLPCDIARSPDGTTYITSMSITVPAPPAEPGYVSFAGWSYYLHERSASGQWSTVEVVSDTGNAHCPSVAYDQGLDRVAVLSHDFGKIRVYSPDLAFISETEFSGLGGHPQDLATINSVFVLALDGATSSLTVIGPDGLVMDSVPMDRAKGVYMQVEDGDLFHVWWTGRDILDEYGAGRVLLTEK